MRITLKKYWPIAFLWVVLIVFAVFTYVSTADCGTDGPFNLCGKEYETFIVLFYGLPLALIVTVLFPILRYFCIDKFERTSK